MVKIKNNVINLHKPYHKNKMDNKTCIGTEISKSNEFITCIWINAFYIIFTNQYSTPVVYDANAYKKGMKHVDAIW